MKRVIAITFALACLIVLAISARSALQAKARLDASRAHLASIESKVAEAERLRSLPVAAALEKRPEPGIVGQLTTSLAAAGLPSSLMTSFNPGSDAPYVLPSNSMGNSKVTSPNGTYRKQEARLTLEPVTLPELGRFLKSCKEQHPEWACAAIEVVPVPQSSTASSDTVPRLRASIGIQAVYLAQGGS
jgi:hypothetical protein